MSSRYSNYSRNRDDRFDRDDDDYRDRQRRTFNRSSNEWDRSEDRSRLNTGDDEASDRYFERQYGSGYTPRYGMESNESFGSYGRRSSRLDRDDYDDRAETYGSRRSSRSSERSGRTNDTDRSMSRSRGNYRPYYEVGDEGYGSYETFLRDQPDARPLDFGYGSGGRERSWADQGRQQRSESRQERSWWDKVTDALGSWFGDDDAERRRHMDEQKGSYRGKGPRGYKRSDDRIREDVNDRLTDYEYLDATDVVVSVDQAIVTLTGSVDSRWARRAAEEIVDTVSGVEDVNNQLRVIRNPALTEAPVTGTQTTQTPTTTSTATEPTSTTRSRTKAAGS